MPSPLRTSPEYRYNPRLGAGGMYQDARTGRIVSNAVIVAELERVQRGVRREAESLATQLQNGDITVQQFYDQFRSNLRILHGLSGALARGGVERMTQSDWGYVGSQARQQYQFLNNFIRQIENGEQPLNGAFLRRVRMYIDAGRRTYYTVRTNVAQKAGFTDERRILHSAKPCRSRRGLTGCIEWASMGWQPIGTLGAIGDSPCRSNCRCQKEFRKSILQPAVNVSI